MAAQPVQWVLVIYYGTSAHRATYGRLDGDASNNRYTKDYIQLSRKQEFLQILNQLFPETIEGGRTEVTYRWPLGTTPGALDFSSDRWHLKWETRRGAPLAWKMFPLPSEHTAETIPGDPSHEDSDSAENEFQLLINRGAGQPYLIAVRLYGQPDTLHLRAYLQGPREEYLWADLGIAPQLIQELAAATSSKKHTSWSPIIESGGVPPTEAINSALSRLSQSPDPRVVIDQLDSATGRSLANYIKNPGRGLFFDPNRNHDPWLVPTPLPEQLSATTGELLELLESRFALTSEGDAAAETMEVDLAEVETFRRDMENDNFAVADAMATVKTRGSAQKAFADMVKSNYGHRCAVTGIATREFLVASHIVPWSMDQTIRLDPANGICLSLLIDRAFEKGYLLIEDNFTIRINWDKVGKDNELRNWLEPYDEQVLNVPTEGGPKLEYLQRRRAMLDPG